jgi:hypothetical protein
MTLAAHGVLIVFSVTMAERLVFSAEMFVWNFYQGVAGYRRRNNSNKSNGFISNKKAPCFLLFCYTTAKNGGLVEIVWSHI